MSDNLSEPAGVQASDLMQRLLELDPTLSCAEIFRVGYFLTLHGDPQRLQDPAYIQQVWIELTLRLQVVADQQSAVSDELDAIARTDPQAFNPHQVWTLIKAIKVLSQVLEFYNRDDQRELLPTD